MPQNFPPHQTYSHNGREGISCIAALPTAAATMVSSCPRKYYQLIQLIYCRSIFQCWPALALQLNISAMLFTRPHSYLSLVSLLLLDPSESSDPKARFGKRQKPGTTTFGANSEKFLPSLLRWSPHNFIVYTHSHSLGYCCTCCCLSSAWMQYTEIKRTKNYPQEFAKLRTYNQKDKNGINFCLHLPVCCSMQQWPFVRRNRPTLPESDRIKSRARQKVRTKTTNRINNKFDRSTMAGHGRIMHPTTASL